MLLYKISVDYIPLYTAESIYYFGSSIWCKQPASEVTGECEAKKQTNNTTWNTHLQNSSSVTIIGTSEVCFVVVCYTDVLD